MAECEDNTRPGLVHRIDKNTSGIIVVAKTSHALVHLQKQFYDRITSRRYRALVWGDFDQDEGTITGNIGRSLRNRKVMDVFPEGDEYGRHAVTHYSVLERFGYVTSVECRLETGRTHQIRVHLSSLGLPILGDKKYCEQVLDKTYAERMYLHAWRLSFRKSGMDRKLHYESPVPAAFKRILKRI